MTSNPFKPKTHKNKLNSGRNPLFSRLAVLQSFLGLTWFGLLQPLPMPHIRRSKSHLNLWILNLHEDIIPSEVLILLYSFSYCGPIDPDAIPDPHAPPGVGRLPAGPLDGEVADM